MKRKNALTELSGSFAQITTENRHRSRKAPKAFDIADPLLITLARALAQTMVFHLKENRDMAPFVRNRGPITVLSVTSAKYDSFTST